MTVSTVVAVLFMVAVGGIVVRSAWSLLFRKGSGPRRPVRGRHLPYDGPAYHAGLNSMPGANGTGCDAGGSGGDSGGGGS